LIHAIFFTLPNYLNASHGTPLRRSEVFNLYNKLCYDFSNLDMRSAEKLI